MKKKNLREDVEKLIANQIEENTKDGLHQLSHPNGRIFREWTVVNGKMDGVLREWAENGILVKEKPMKRGVAHGVMKRWNLEGKFLGQYKMEMGEGIVRDWNENGVLETETEHCDNRTTRVKIYGDPKRRFHEAFFWNDKPISKKRFYDLNPNRKPKRT